VELRRLEVGELPEAARPLARALLGRILVRETADGLVAGRIVETEAYLPGDPACHAYGGVTPRNVSLFGPPHRSYVYQIYGTSFCFNLSSEPEGTGGGVLVRALEPVLGEDVILERRPGSSIRDACRGPGRLCTALAIDRSLDGLDVLTDSGLWLAAGEPLRPSRVRVSPRIGLTRAASRPLRYYEAGNPYVSGPLRAIRP
jgi:DNA-3-methyladenine glycosylase